MQFLFQKMADEFDEFDEPLIISKLAPQNPHQIHHSHQTKCKKVFHSNWFDELMRLFLILIH